MAQRTGLGKGLEVLLGDVSQGGRDGITEVAIGQLDPNREQARKEFDQDKLQDLANSIKVSGVIQPLLVVKNGDRYMIVAGERRFRAARLAGVKTLPVIVREYGQRELMEVSLIENLQREDLNAVDEAAGIRLLMEQHDFTQEEVSVRLGKSRSAVANTLRLLTLPEEVLAMLRSGRLSAGHARALVSIDDRAEQIRLAELVADEKLPVRQIEKITQAKQKKTARIAPEGDNTVLFDVESELRDLLETKVSIAGTLEKGRIVIEYYSREQLESIYELIKR